MRKKQLEKELVRNGFNYDKYRALTKSFAGLDICVSFHSIFLGRISMVSIFYRFKQELPEQYHDEVWDTCENVLDKSNKSVIIGGLGLDFLEASILDKRALLNLDAKFVEDSCSFFAKQIKPIVDKFRL